MRVALAVSRAGCAARPCSTSRATHWLTAPQVHPCAFSVRSRRASRARCHAVLQSSDDVDAATHVVDVTYDDGFEGEFCMPGEIAVDNDSSKRFTILTVEVKDYPGLLRVIAWVVNGLDLLVENARLVTDEEGYAKNRFWLTDRRGRKLSSSNADLLAERVGDFVVYCTPDRKTMQAKQYASNGVHINNEAHNAYSVVTIAENRERASALLEVASAMTGIGIVIHEAVIQGSKVGKVPKLAEAPEVDVPESGAAFKFWVTDRQNAKLDYARATALLYTLGLVFGRSSGPLQPPNASKFVLA